MMKLAKQLGLVCLLGAWLVVFCCLCETALAQEDDVEVPISEAELAAAERAAVQTNKEVRANFQLPKMFNFDHFKRAFRKHYGSALEELVRMKLYLGRAYRAFLTAVKYKYRQAKYYLAVNYRFDWTQAELDGSLNGAAAFDIPQGINVANGANKAHKAVESKEPEPACDGRYTFEQTRARQEQRQMSLEAQDEPKTSRPSLSGGLLSGLYGWLWGSDGQMLESREDSKENPNNVVQNLDDVVWVDHRRSNCLMPVQEQGRCGACYIFSTTAFYEWAHCIETGEKLKFSEQYVLDCGGRVDGIDGCAGGFASRMSLFVANFGLELARFYPYKARHEQCPYDHNLDLSSYGYLRSPISYLSVIELDEFEQQIAYSPIVMSISPKGDFSWYGGGVYDGNDCGPQGTHSVLLIGHGREDGQQYWLIRNSYSEDYGEQGHMKLNKKSDCIHPEVGFVYGELKDNRVRLEAARNPHVPAPIMLATKRLEQAASNQSTI